LGLLRGHYIPSSTPNDISADRGTPPPNAEDATNDESKTMDPITDVTSIRNAADGEQVPRSGRVTFEFADRSDRSDR